MTFDPTTHDHLLYAIPFQALNPAAYKQGIANDGDAADEAGELVGSVATGISGVNLNASSMAPSTERRVPLGSVGGVLGMEGTASRGLRHNNSYANVLHEARMGWVIAFYALNASVTSGRPLIDSTNLANPTANAQGLFTGTQAFLTNGSTGGLFRKKNGSLARVMLKGNVESPPASGLYPPIIHLITEEDLDAASEAIHRFEAYIDPDDLSFAQTDEGRKAYGLVTGAAGSGNSTVQMSVMNRGSLDSFHFPGKLFALGVYSQYPGSAARQEWIDAAMTVLGTVGSIQGSPEARVADHHQNFSRDQAGMPYCHWFGKQRVSGVNLSSGNENGGNVVFNDGVSTDYLGGSTGWCGGPHRNETLNSATVSIDGAAPVAFENGQIYQGNTSVSVVRNTTIGVSFDQTETNTITRNTRRVHTLLTRKGDARTISTMVYRVSRDSTFEDALVFNAAGEILHDVTVDASTFACDPGAMAIAQWSPTGVLALTVVRNGGLGFTAQILFSASEARRIYFYPTTIATGTGTMEFETLEKFYLDVAEEDWKALARNELLATLAEGSEQGHGIIALQWAGMVSF